MRKLLGTLVLGLLVIAAVGLFRGWFQLSTGTESDKTKLEIIIDKERVKQDTDRLKQTVNGLSEQFPSGQEAGSEDNNEIQLPPSNGQILPPDSADFR